MNKQQLIEKFISFLGDYNVKIGSDIFCEVCKLFYDDAQQKWEPIETAPRDGTPVLVNGKYSSVCAFFDKENGEWLYHDYPDAYNLYSIDPTKWMPLPELQKQDE